LTLPAEAVAGQREAFCRGLEKSSKKSSSFLNYGRQHSHKRMSKTPPTTTTEEKKNQIRATYLIINTHITKEEEELYQEKQQQHSVHLPHFPTIYHGTHRWS
jgi:hypothetical protein